MAFLPIARPRSEAPANRRVSQWSRWAGLSRDDEIPNPWLRPLAQMAATDTTISSALNEGHWRSMEQSPAIMSGVSKRISLSMSKGWDLRPGKGPEAERLFDFWSTVTERLRFYSFLEKGFRSIFTGWAPIETFRPAGDLSRVNGAQVRVPRELIAAENAHFAFTAGRDLIHKPPGRMSDWKIWRMGSFGAKLKWCLYQQGIGMPYGESVYGQLVLAEYFARVLGNESIIALRKGAGIPMVERTGGPTKLAGADEGAVETAADAKARIRVKGEIADMIDQLSASGVLVVPRGWKVEYLAAVGSMEGWVKVLQMQSDEMTAAILGGNLLGQAGGGSSGSRAAGEVQLQVSMQQALSDARKVSELVRRRLFLPWSALNAAALGIPTASITPSLDDIPLEALPTIQFPNLRRPDKEALGIFLDKVRVEPEQAEEFRIDLRSLAADYGIPLLREGEEGPFPDLARQPPPDFGEGEDEGPPPGDESDVEDETEDARDGRPNRERR